MMDLWFYENHTENVRLSFRVKKQLFSETSEHQHIEIMDTQEFGKVLIMDDCVMMTEKDERAYHEMIVHIPLAVHRNPENVLLIGGGDGGALRELVKYPELKSIDMVEIDEVVVAACRKYLDGMEAAYHDSRVKVYYADGLRFVRNCQKKYDLIIVDSTDPFGPGESLFTREFYANCRNALREDGILVNQHESPFYQNDAEEVRRAHAKTTAIFRYNRLFQVHIPTYPSGHWLFGFMSNVYEPVRDLDAARWNARGLETFYYNTNLHSGCFALPTFVNKMLEEVT